MKIIKLIIILFSLFPLSKVNAKENSVYLIKIDREIGVGLVPYVKRGIEEAEKNKADAILFEINTFGGRVDAATQLKDLIVNAKLPTIAFVNKRAISAGALITLSARKIVMAPGSSIGATTVVNQAGKKQSEKYQSFMRSEMRATAEENGRPKKIAEGMVDERIVVPGLVDSTKLITLTAEEAVHYGIADTVLSDVKSALAWAGYPDAEVIEVNENAGEEIVSFLNHPIVVSLLLMVGMVGMFVEIKTPGWGIAGTLSLIAFFLFFGSGLILELVSALDIILFIVGVVALILEIFVIPGFGVFGIIGIVSIIASLFLGLMPSTDFLTPEAVQLAIWELTGALVATIIFSYFLLKILPKSKMFNKLILKDHIAAASGYTVKENVRKLFGKEGRAISDLRPAGIGEFDGNRIDVVTEGDYIENGEKIIVIAEEGSKVVVKKIS